jgi:hypothetical protein
LDENQQAQFSALKTSRVRVIDISAETVRLLRAHKAAQAALMMRKPQDLPRPRLGLRGGAAERYAGRTD